MFTAERAERAEESGMNMVGGAAPLPPVAWRTTNMRMRFVVGCHLVSCQANRSARPYMFHRVTRKKMAGTVAILSRVVRKMARAASGVSPPKRSVKMLQLMATGMLAMR